MPDALSLAIGGGTIVTCTGSEILLGPESVGSGVTKESYCFGGNTLTITDIAIKCGRMQIIGANADKVPLDDIQARAVMSRVDSEIAKAVLLVRGKNSALPVIICGGGAPIGYREGMILPEDYGFANAYGAAMAGVSHTIDQTVSLIDRNATLDRLKETAIAQAIARGASSASTRITHVEVSPYAYSKEALARVIVTASGSHA
jgi:N-methylhydantoinase A/oxoprolinase/acetone carboxylase beta subunit